MPSVTRRHCVGTRGDSARLILQTTCTLAIIPDAIIHCTLPAVATRRGARQDGRVLPARMLLFDAKTTYGGSSWYGP